MIIRIALIALICALLFWFLKQQSSVRAQAWSKIGSLVLFVLAVFTILFPESTNALAHGVGVGRGADLLLYLLTIAFLLSLLLQYMHRSEEKDRIVRLARRIAISDGLQNPRNQKLLAKRHD
jgi:hypothetical protein